jgi:hypothetical protein
MLQQCSGASSCVRMCIVMEEHYTGCHHSTPFIRNDSTQFFGVSQYTSDVIVVPCCINSTISTLFLSQKSVANSFLADIICLNVSYLFGECMCIHYID